MTALRFQTGGDIRHPRPPFERVIVVVVFVEVTVVVVVIVVIGLLGVHDLKKKKKKSSQNDAIKVSQSSAHRVTYYVPATNLHMDAHMI